jgi:superfamily II DNA or RNA helicase
MHNLLPPTLNTGDLVHLRGALWRIRRLTPGDDCHAVEVHGAERRNRIDTRTVLTPFDRPVVVDRPNRLEVVGRRAWMRRLTTLGASAARWDEPLGLASLRVDILAWQLEPALALLRGVALRVLVADEVGMGKTVQAALAVSALRDAGLADRVLVVCPAGLRDQWRDELSSRAGLSPTVVEVHDFAARTRLLPNGVTPWSSPGLFIVSSDLVKRAEHLNALDGLAWDVLVIDEAHAMTAGSDRGRAAAALAERSVRVVLLTATPHDGDDARFRVLCGLGADGAGDRLAIFRRSREDVGLCRDRVQRTLRVTPSPAERRLHQALERYVTSVMSAGSGAPLARLAMSVLLKRSYSCPTALGLTLGRRLVLLSQAPSPAERQASLPFDDESSGDEVDDAVLGAPGLTDTRHERAWLGRLVELARQAARDERKLAALARFIRRIREPVLVFTEYRDTLAHVLRRMPRGLPIAVVHGGLSPDERRQALDEFVHGQAMVLLSTDAAAEGLNLHRRCRLVVHLELPWSPRRLEQRVGRVDRLGQPRRVHALALLGKDTREEALFARLHRKQTYADASLGDLMASVASAVPEATTAPPALVEAHLEAASRNRPREMWRPQLRTAGEHLAARLVAIRALGATHGARTRDRAEIVVARARGRRWSFGPQGWLAITAADVETESGTSICRIVPIWIARPLPAGRSGCDVRAAARACLDSCGAALVETATRDADAWVSRELERLGALEAGERNRRERVSRRLGQQLVREAQPGLFDRRPAGTDAASSLRPHPLAERSASSERWLARRSSPRIVLMLAVTRGGR